MSSSLDKSGRHSKRSDDNVVGVKQIQEITQSLETLPNCFMDFDLDKMKQKKAPSYVCKMASYPKSKLVSKFFYHCFGYNKRCLIPTITQEVIISVGDELEKHFKATLKRKVVNLEQFFIPLEPKFHISATFGCLNRLASTGMDGYINDEAISIFVDALNYHLGHRKKIELKSEYFVLDSIAANNFVMLDEYTAAKQSKFEFPNSSDKFVSYLFDNIHNGFLNKPVLDIFMSSATTRPDIIGCLNIMNDYLEHFYMFEYKHKTNKIVSRDPLHHPDNEIIEDHKYERMWVAKSFGLMRSIKENHYKNIYCGASDMFPDGYLPEDKIENSNSAFHEGEVNRDLPPQSDAFNCGPFALHYIASKVFKFDESTRQNFDPLSFRRRLLIFIVGLKFYQEIENKAYNTDVFDAGEYTLLNEEDDLLDLLHFFSRITAPLKKAPNFWNIFRKIITPIEKVALDRKKLKECMQDIKDNDNVKDDEEFSLITIHKKQNVSPKSPPMKIPAGFEGKPDPSKRSSSVLMSTSRKSLTRSNIKSPGRRSSPDRYADLAQKAASINKSPVVFGNTTSSSPVMSTAEAFVHQSSSKKSSISSKTISSVQPSSSKTSTASSVHLSPPAKLPDSSKTISSVAMSTTTASVATSTSSSKTATTVHPSPPTKLPDSSKTPASVNLSPSKQLSVSSTKTASVATSTSSSKTATTVHPSPPTKLPDSSKTPASVNLSPSKTASSVHLSPSVESSSSSKTTASVHPSPPTKLPDSSKTPASVNLSPSKTASSVHLSPSVESSSSSKTTVSDQSNSSPSKQTKRRIIESDSEDENEQDPPFQFHHYCSTIEHFAINAWKKIQPKERETNWFHRINLTDLITNTNSQMFRQSLVDIASVKDEMNTNRFYLFIATRLKDKTNALKEACVFMHNMFPEDHKNISNLFHQNDGYLLLFQMKIEEKYKFIAGTLFSRYQEQDINTIIIDYLAITNESPKIQYCLYDRFLWEGKGIASLLLSLIQAFGFESFQRKECMLRLKCNTTVKSFYDKIGFEDDLLDYSKYSSLANHQRFVKHKQPLPHSLCLPGHKQISLNDESISRPIDVDFANFGTYKDRAKVDFTKQYRFQIQDYSSSKNEKYNNLVESLRTQFESSNTTDQKILSDNEVLLPIGDIILGMMDESENHLFYKSKLFQLNRFCLSKIAWIISPKKYKAPKDDDTNIFELPVRGKEGVLCYELNVVCILCKQIIFTVNEFEIKFQVKWQIKTDQTIDEAEKLTQLNSVPNATHKAINILVTEGMQSCFNNHFGLGGNHCECRGLTRSHYEEYNDSKHIQKYEMNQKITVDRKEMKNDTREHQFVFFNTVFDFFNNFEVVVSTFNWRSWSYNERSNNIESKKRRRSSLTSGRTIRDETFNEIAGLNESKKRKKHQTIERKKQHKRIVEQAKREAEDSEFVESNLSIGYVNHETDKRTITMIMNKIDDHETVWKQHHGNSHYFIGFNRAQDKCMLLYESWIKRVLGKQFATQLKQKENIDKMFPLTNDHYAKIQIDLVKRKEKNITIIHKYLDKSNKYQLCPSTKVYDANGTFVNHRHHKKDPITHEWMEELRELNPDHKQFLKYLEEQAGPGTYDLPVGSSLDLDSVMDLSLSASLSIPSKEKNAYDIKYQQEDYNTCGISALCSALHTLIHPDVAKAIILKKQEYLDAHKKEKYNTKNNEMKMLIEACNKLRGKYKYHVIRLKQNDFFSIDSMKNGQEYYKIVVCLLKDSHERNDHIVVISHGQIFDSRFEYSFGLSKDNMNFICGAYSYQSFHTGFLEQFFIENKN